MLELLLSLTPLQVVGSLLLIFIHFHLALVFYNLYLHPLRHYPGLKRDAASQLLTSYYLIKGNYCKHIAALHERFGDVVRTGPNELSYITDSAHQEIYGPKTRHEDVYEKNPVVYLQGSGQVLNVFFAQSREHARYRKLIGPAFSEAAVREQEQALHTFLDRFLDGLRNRSGKACYPDRDGVVDLAAWYTFFVFDVLTHLSFGAAVGCLAQGDHHPWVRAVYGAITHSTYTQAAHRLAPYGRLLERLIPDSIGGDYEKHMAFARRTMEKRDEATVGRSDFMAFITRGMTPEELLDNINIIVTAGGETTATTLASLTYYLTHNPDSYARLTHEIRSSFAHERDITIASTRTLPYLTAVINENFRIHPPVPVGLPRVVPAGGRVIDGRFVPGGTWVSMTNLAACRTPRHFRWPDKFIPERWLGDAEFASDRREVLHPFLVGPRRCIAINLANANMRLAIVRLLWNFDLEAHPENEDPHSQSESGIWQGRPLRTRLIPVGVNTQKCREVERSLAV